MSKDCGVDAMTAPAQAYPRRDGVDHPELGTAGRVERVARLIDGFQSSYGMELLASVHWVAMHEDNVRSAEAALSAVHAWNPRKKTLIAPSHVSAAWKRLEGEGWLPNEDATSSARPQPS